MGTWDYDCKACHSRCWSCFGSTNYHCFSCDQTLYDHHLKGTTCPEFCGDSKYLGELECDDGNTDDDDGCSKYCHWEAGFACVQGTPTTRTTCAEICGDGRRIKDPCDDGNTVNGDGCDSACQIETGWTCHHGSRNDQDTCTEICGDGLNIGNYECDDGNDNNGDGCDAVCRVERGYSCSGGSTNTSDTCVETCGDGMRLSQNACDDGNTEDGDGCSNSCEVETGWSCDGLSPTFCYKAGIPVVESTTSNGTHFFVNFNETINLAGEYLCLKVLRRVDAQ